MHDGTQVRTYTCTHSHSSRRELKHKYRIQFWWFRQLVSSLFAWLQLTPQGREGERERGRQGWREGEKERERGGEREREEREAERERGRQG